MVTPTKEPYLPTKGALNIHKRALDISISSASGAANTRAATLTLSAPEFCNEVAFCKPAQITQGSSKDQADRGCAREQTKP